MPRTTPARTRIRRSSRRLSSTRRHATWRSVAASGNCDATCPYPFASYPAALSHVIGVSAVAVDGSVPQFSNRDACSTTWPLPVSGIVSTFPRELSNDPGCGHPGYSICATSPDYRDGAGTSFAAPLVTAAAALAISVEPSLSPGQIAGLVGATARDVGRPGRDAATGSGRARRREPAASRRRCHHCRSPTPSSRTTMRAKCGDGRPSQQAGRSTRRSTPSTIPATSIGSICDAAS